MQHESESAEHERAALLAALPQGCVVSVQGADAVAVVNNLTTADVRKLPISGVCESFVTDVRGWVVAHGMVVRLPDEVWLVGQFPQPDSIVKHIDRYIVREAATPRNISDEFSVYLLDGASSDSLLAAIFGDEAKLSARAAVASLAIADSRAMFIAAPVTSSRSRLAIVPKSLESQFRDTLLARGFEWCDREEELGSRRIAGFWPLAGREIVEKTLPQELDRDSTAISFTKGCYLGQETVARLDARGQLQKKLCLLRVVGQSGEMRELSRDGQPAGHVTSLGVAALDGPTLALGYVKRGNFDPGTRLRCGELDVEVLERPRLKS